MFNVLKCNIWRNLFFTDESKIKLDIPYGLRYHCHDARAEPYMLSKCVQGSVMIWVGFNTTGKTRLVFTMTNINFFDYQDNFGQKMIPVRDELMEQNLTLL